ncbi:MAG TPA: hypothetical protein VJZ94_01910 [Candidatus Paceibacterota bacterium]|nr:hypothetical protein [Candidatus Paceibacterota bacterium]
MKPAPSDEAFKERDYSYGKNKPVNPFKRKLRSPWTKKPHREREP